MNQQNPGPGSSSGAPLKRKRGRPRKEQSVVQGQNVPPMQRTNNVLSSNQTMGTVPAMPRPDSGLLSSNQTMGTTTNDCDDEMVGNVVTGVVEAAFNAGYLINVKVEGSDTLLRGLVFIPGKVSPVTAENDVAPHINMIKRKELPVPTLNPQTEVQGSFPAPVQCSKQSSQPETQVPMSVEQVLPTEVHSGVSVPPENQSASTPIPMADLPKNGTSSSSGGILPGISETGRAAIISELACGKTVKQGFALHELDASKQVKESSADGGATKDSVSEPASQTINLFPTIENTDKELRTGQQPVPYMPQLNQVIHEAPNASNIEFNLIHVTAEPKSIPSEQTSKPVDNFVEEQALPKADLLEETKKECAIDTLSKVDTSIGKPSTCIADMNVEIKPYT